MTMAVTAPDGATINFPDGTAPSMINSVMMQYHSGSLKAPEQMGGAAREIAMPASNFAKGLAQMISPMLSGVPGSSTGLMATPEQIQGALTQPAETYKAGQDAGLYDRSDLTPQTMREKYEAAGFQGAGAALPMAALSPTTALPAILSGFGGGMGSLAGQEAMPNHPVIGSLLGGAAGGVGAGTLANAATRVGNAVTGNLSDIGQAYKTAGVPMTLPGAVSDSPFFKTMTAYGSKSLGGAGRTQAAIQQTNSAFGDSVENTARSLEGTMPRATSLDEVGRIAQSGANKWIADFKNNNAQVWNGVDAKLAGAPVDLAPVSTVLSDMAAKSGGNQAAQTFLQSPLAKQIQQVVAASPNGQVPWETAQAIRSRVGEYLETPALISDAGGTQAKRFYGAFSDAMQQTAANHPDPQVARLFGLANQYTSAGHDFIDSTLSPIVRDGVTPDKAAKSILGTLNSGGTVASNLRQNMPDVANSVGAFKLRDMALANPGAQNAAGDTVSPGTFLTDLNKLSPEARKALYPDPAVQAKIDALAKISGGIKEAQTLVNHSNTTHMAAPMVMFEAGKQGAEALAPLGVAGRLTGFVGGAAALPAFNRGLSYLGANRPLASLLAANPGAAPRGLPSAMGAYVGLLNAPRTAGLLGP